MKYQTYIKRYNSLIKRFLALGVRYIRKVFWKLQESQVKRYARVQLASMKQALDNLLRAE